MEPSQGCRESGVTVEECFCSEATACFIMYAKKSSEQGIPAHDTSGKCVRHVARAGDEEEVEFDEVDIYGEEQQEANLHGEADVHSSEVDVASGVVLPYSSDEEDALSLKDEEEKVVVGVGVSIPQRERKDDASSDLGSLPKFSPRAETDGIAMSLPGTHLLTRFHSSTQQEADAALMGTSAPIRIPKVQRKAILEGSPGMAARTGLGADFVPPHLLEDNAENFGLLSPSTSVKREKLVARNAILRSTGFIEVQSFTAPTSEIIDAVKESVMPETETTSPSRTTSDALNIKKQTSPRKPMASSLTAMLSTSK